MAAPVPATLRAQIQKTPAHRFDLFGILKDHYRAGYSRPLLWFDSLLATPLIIDILRFLFQSASISLSGVGEILRPASGFLGPDLVQVLLLVLVMMVIVPALVAIVRIGGWVGDNFGGPLSASPNHILVFHSVLCVLCSAALVLGHALEILSGQTSRGHYLFESSLYNAWVSSTVLTWVFITLGGGLVVETAHALIAYAIHGEEFANPIKQYLVRAELADLPAEWLPIQSPSESGVAPSQDPPRIKLIQEMYLRKLGQFRNVPSGSAESRRILIDVMARCETAIRTQLFENEYELPSAATDGPSVNFFVGRYRMFEPALSRLARPRTLVLSPFVNPSVAALLKWYAFQTGDNLRTIQFSPADHLRQWEEQESRILECFRSIQTNCHGSVLFLDSEVFYATCRRIPLVGYLEKLRAAANHTPFHIVVDGTNAVANNCLIQTKAAWDSYVFSTQRWLMAAEPCGVLLSRKDLPGPEPESPDVIRPEARNSETQLRALAGLASAMEAIGQQRRGIEFFFSRCKRLREELRLGMPSTTQVVGDALNLKQTFILALCPSDGHRWRFDNATELEHELQRRRVKASVIKLDPRCAWVRMALPFYLDAREITRASKFLKEATR